MIIDGLCADYSSPYCPCILAETGDCVVCSQVNGSDFCDCKISGAFCVQQELIRNGGKAKPGRKTYECRVTTVLSFEGLVFLRVQVPYELENEVKRPGGFVFVRRKDADVWFDTPISVMYEEMHVGSIGMSILLRGVKTSQFANIVQGDTLLVRGPYMSGLLGLQHIEKQQAGKCLVLAKGIGLLPSMAVVRYLQSKHNEVEVHLDEGGFPASIQKFCLDLFDLHYQAANLLDSAGQLREETKATILRFAVSGGTLIHVGGSEYVIHKVAEYIETVGLGAIRLSACNNANMCCGEGICGACTETTAGKRVIHHCKEQVNPRKIR